MSRIVILGTSNAMVSIDHEYSHMVVCGEERSVLVDCGSNPLPGLMRARVNHQDLTDVILTHFHPDHVSGFALLLMGMWLMGRRRPLIIHGLDHTMHRAEALMNLYGWRDWPVFFPVSFHTLPEKEMIEVFTCSEFNVLASPACHLIPSISLRFRFQKSSQILAYSGDTEPCQSVIQLAERADILIHESTGKAPGHSSGKQAGEVANQAGVARLLLIHYPSGMEGNNELIRQASYHFKGNVNLATDYLELDI